MAIKVVKFGGSSLADAKQFEKVASIVKADPDRRYVVASAPGKRSSDDIKVTDMLYDCYKLAAKKQSIELLDPDERCSCVTPGSKRPGEGGCMFRQR